MKSKIALSPLRATPSLAGLALALALTACSGATATPPDAGTPQTASFTLDVSVDKVPVLQGSTATFDVTVTRAAGFTGPVTLTFAGLPAGVSVEPATVIAADQTTLSIAVAAAPTAPHSLPTAITISGASGAAQASRAVTVTVYGPPGSLDTSFGTGGKVVVPVGAGEDAANAMVVQPDGKLVIAGRGSEHGGDFALVRLDRDGALDATFGAGGKVLTDFGGGSDIAYAIALQPDGKLVVAGSSGVGSGGNDFGVARFTADGALDPTFGTGGKVVTAFGADSDTAFAVLVEPDGSILVGGESNQGSSATGVDFALARYTAAGALDPTFGTGGKVVSSLVASSGRDTIYALSIQTVAGERRIVAAGGEGDFSVARYTMNGQLDPTFGTNGKVTGILGSAIGAAYAVQVTVDGKILLGGHLSHHFALACLTTAGVLDATFGAGGKTITPVTAESWDEARGLAIESDGRIVAAGWAYETGSSGNFAVARYDRAGLLDPTFGAGGIAISQVAAPGKADQAAALALQPDERVPTVRIVTAGFASGSNYDFAVTRSWR